MRTRVRYKFAAVTAMVFFMVASVEAQESFFNVSPPRPPEPPPVCELCQVLERQLAEGCGPNAGQPFADVHELRHPGTLSLPEDVLVALGRARATQDPAAAALRLAPLYDHADGDVRYVSGITVAMMHLRADNIDAHAAETALTVARTAASNEEITIPGSDLAFILARRAHAAGQTDSARAYLSESLRLDPQYFNAMILHLDLALERAIHAGQQSRAVCEATYFELMQRLVAIMDLSPCRFQAAHLDVYLSRRFLNPDQLAAVQLSRVYLGLLAGRQIAAEAALEQFGGADLPCRDSQLWRLEQLVASQRPVGE